MRTIQSFVTAIIVISCGAAMTFGDSGPWLNVRDCGASGSEFETTATTSAGENLFINCGEAPKTGSQARQ